MKTKLLSSLAALLLAFPAVAENLNQTQGEVNETGKISYTWSYWNDVKTDSDWAVWPNWAITIDPTLAEAPAAVTLDFVLKKDNAQGETISTGTQLTPSNGSLTTPTFYAGPIPALGEGTFYVESTLYITPAGATEAQATSFSSTFTSQAKPEDLYNFVFSQTTTATDTEIHISYEFTERDGQDIPEGAEYFFQAGIVGFTDQIARERKGEIVFTGATPGTEYMIYSNNPRVTIDGKSYSTNYPNWTVKTEEGSGDPQETYNFEFKQTTTTTANTITIEYEFVEKDGKEVPENATYFFQAGLTPGGIDKFNDTRTGTVVFDNLQPGTEYTIWSNNPYVTIDGKKYETNYPNWTATPMADDIPVLSLTCSNPVALTSTTGTVDYVVTTDKPELEGITYKLWAVTVGDRAVSDVVEITDLTGKLNLKDLNESAETELWVKVQATTADGLTSNIAQYPGEAQGWTGLSINTNSTGIENVAEDANAPVNVYNAAGVCVRRGISKAEINNLPAGLYIVNGKKFIIK